MKEAKRKALEAAGWRVGDAAEFLGLSEQEEQLVALRVALARAVRRRRAAGGLSQHDLAARMKSSQSRVAKIEAGAAGVSLDLMFRGLFAAGGKISDVATARTKARRSAARRAHL
jgi:ribosome-binding protein aMBF1 (putative translation factor)